MLVYAATPVTSALVRFAAPVNADLGSVDLVSLLGPLAIVVLALWLWQHPETFLRGPEDEEQADLVPRAVVRGIQVSAFAFLGTYVAIAGAYGLLDFVDYHLNHSLEAWSGPLQFESIMGCVVEVVAGGLLLTFVAKFPRMLGVLPEAEEQEASE